MALPPCNAIASPITGPSVAAGLVPARGTGATMGNHKVALHTAAPVPQGHCRGMVSQRHESQRFVGTLSRPAAHLYVKLVGESGRSPLYQSQPAADPLEGESVRGFRPMVCGRVHLGGTQSPLDDVRVL
ncbi:MAG: hypothetical protein KatS3mg077_1298 [Candidatus Binatia bacterium]|nr:MAG: hypothetical protein KatS3mg077_1298 [Candidatus Binatia bacterium]